MDDRGVLELLEEDRVDRETDLTYDVMHLISRDKYSLHSLSFTGPTRIVEEVSHPKEIFRTTTIYHCP